MKLMDNSNALPHLVLLGGGHSQIEVLRRFAMHPPRNARVSLVSRHALAPYSGMLPGYIAGHYCYNECHIDLSALARAAGALFIESEVEGLDADARKVRIADRPDLSFDYLSINTGSTPTVSDVPGASTFAIPAKPVDAFIEAWESTRARVLESTDAFRIVIVGAGAGGVELALAMRHRLNSDAPNAYVDIELVTAAPSVLASHNAGARRRIKQALHRAGISVRTGARVFEVTAELLQIEDAQTLEHDALFWVTHASPPAWITASGVAVDERGFLEVDAHLRSQSHSYIFASGDIASMTENPRPKSGVFAVRQGPVLAENLVNTLNGESLVPYEPQQQFLSLLATGPKHAVASRGPFAAQGKLLWKWKDHIDRTFMEKYEVNDMTAPMPEGNVMACSGCGAKFGASELDIVLRRLREQYGPECVALESLDDAAIQPSVASMDTLHSIDGFPALMDDPFAFGRIAATHALNDIYAMGGEAVTALAYVTLPRHAASTNGDRLYLALAGITETLRDDGARLIGGHTIEGPEFQVALSVQGQVASNSALRKSGLRDGDVLILNKPIGSGVLFAAAMRKRARMPWLAAAQESMRQSNRAMVDVMRAHGVVAATDISGFGLAGHLLEMLRASQIGANLDPNALPFFEGARECVNAGIDSTLYPSNEAAFTGEMHHYARENATHRLTLDPQTGGGIVCGVAADRAAAFMEDLLPVYPHARIVGSCVASDAPQLTFD